MLRKEVVIQNAKNHFSRKEFEFFIYPIIQALEDDGNSKFVFNLRDKVDDFIYNLKNRIENNSVPFTDGKTYIPVEDLKIIIDSERTKI